MKIDNIKKLAQTLGSLDKKAQELDESIINLKSQINELFWDLVEVKKKNHSKKL